jgi:hypothetical protein
MMQRSLRAAFFALVVAIIAGGSGASFAAPPAADTDRSGLQEFSATTGYGFSQKGNVQIMPAYFRFAWYFPDLIDQPLAEHNFNLKWFIEPWLAGVTNHQNAIEVGATLLALKLDYDRGQQVVPFVLGGSGAMYTGLQGLKLGGPFEFASFAGGGIHLFLTDQWALSFSYRIRHISNARIKEPNSGLNTQFLLIGLENFPGR